MIDVHSAKRNLGRMPRCPYGLTSCRKRLSHCRSWPLPFRKASRSSRSIRQRGYLRMGRKTRLVPSNSLPKAANRLKRLSADWTRLISISWIKFPMGRFNRMLKKPASGVLSSQKSSTGTRPPHHSAARTDVVLLIRRTVRPRGDASSHPSLRACWGQGVSLGEEAVLADSGRAGEIGDRAGRVRSLDFLSILFRVRCPFLDSASSWPIEFQLLGSSIDIDWLGHRVKGITPCLVPWGSRNSSLSSSLSSSFLGRESSRKSVKGSAKRSEGSR